MRQIILASGSPRRQELVAQMGIAFKAVVSDYDERLDDARTAEEVAEELGLGKARAVAEKYPEALVIGSDTIVSFEGRQLGKQPDEAAARRLLRAMSGKAVVVTSSVALVCRATGIEEVSHETARIVFGPYSDESVDAYLASGEWQDKAGAVAIQSPAWPGVDHIEGSYATVLGLPIATLGALLQAQGFSTQTEGSQAPWPLRAAAKSA